MIDKKTKGAIEISMAIILFATLVYVFTFVFLSSAVLFPSVPVIPSMATMTQCTQQSCGFADVFCFLNNILCPIIQFFTYMVNLIVRFAGYLVALFLVLGFIAINVFSFAFIWIGYPFFCTGSACIISPFPTPINLLMGIPLLAMSVFVIVDAIKVIIGILPYFGKH